MTYLHVFDNVLNKYYVVPISINTLSKRKKEQSKKILIIGKLKKNWLYLIFQLTAQLRF